MQTGTRVKIALFLHFLYIFYKEGKNIGTSFKITPFFSFFSFIFDLHINGNTFIDHDFLFSRFSYFLIA